MSEPRKRFLLKDDDADDDVPNGNAFFAADNVAGAFVAVSSSSNSVLQRRKPATPSPNASYPLLPSSSPRLPHQTLSPSPPSAQLVCPYGQPPPPLQPPQQPRPNCLPLPATVPAPPHRGCRHFFHKTLIALLFLAVALMLLLQQDSLAHIQKELKLLHERTQTVAGTAPPVTTVGASDSSSHRQLRGVEPRQLQHYGFQLPEAQKMGAAGQRYQLPADVDVSQLALLQLCCSSHMGVLHCSRDGVKAVKDMETGQQYFVVRPRTASVSCMLTYSVYHSNV